MANVQYMVLYRYIHPVSGKPVSNKKKGYKPMAIHKSNSLFELTPESELKINDIDKMHNIKGDTESDKINQYSHTRNYTSDDCYDMMFLFNNIKNVHQYDTVATHHEVMADTFIQVNGDPWFTASVTGSLQAAMEAARRLIRKIGVGNVKVVKQVPLDIEVVIE